MVAKLLHVRIEEGTKTLLFKGQKSKKFYLITLSAHLRVDKNALEVLLKEEVFLASGEEIEKNFGLVKGGIPPFGKLLHIEAFFDEKILEEKRAVFSLGNTFESIIMNSTDLVEIVEPILAKISGS